MNTQFSKSILAILFCLGISFGSIAQAAEYGGGSGTVEEPYEIWTPEQMNTIGLNSGDWSKHFKLMEDIDMSIYTGTQYNIIGYSNSYYDQIPFTGMFDGDGLVIRNLTYTTTATVDTVGVFGYISGATIQNLIVENVSIASGGNYVGGLVGLNYQGSIDFCYVTGAVSGSSYVGGLLGRNYYGIMSNCCALSAVGGSGYCVGGLTGSNRVGTILSSYATGAVSGTSALVGGLVGDNDEGTISWCYATGNVSGHERVGGLAGENEEGKLTSCYATGVVNGTGGTVGGLVGDNDGTINSCYAMGDVNGTYDSVGGLVGKNYSYTNTNNFWDIETSNQNSGVGIGDSSGVTGLDTTAMQTLSTFTAAGWDFTNETLNGTSDIWRMCVDGVDYPHLNWESIDGDFTCPDGVNTEDLSYYTGHWLMNDCNSDNNYCGGADLNSSGVVDLTDWAIFAENWLL